MKWKIELDEETNGMLIAIAIRERRPPDWQAEVMLKEAIRTFTLPVEPPDSSSTTECTAQE